MMISDIDKFLLKSLRREKKSRLSLIEQLALGWRGKRDGRHGLPREDAEGQWTSPTIQKELNSCNESHNRIYGTLQIKLAEKYQMAGRLADRLEHHGIKIGELELYLPKALTDAESAIRKYGEEKLTDTQVQNRRFREYERQKQKYQAQIDQAREEAEKDYEKLIELKNELIQKNYEAELVCERIRSHTQQRIDYYWNAASYALYENNQIIPASFTQVQIPDAAEAYRTLHMEKEQKITETIHKFDMSKEESQNGNI